MENKKMISDKQSNPLIDDDDDDDDDDGENDDIMVRDN